MENNCTIAVCENMQLEARAVLASPELSGVELIVFPSRCGRPPLAWEEVAALFRDRTAGTPIHLLGGCCVAALANAKTKEGNCIFHCVENCFYFVNTRNFIDNLVCSGAYMATPGWLTQWQGHTEKWGFTKAGAREFFSNAAKKILLLDTGVIPDILTAGQQFADYAGLPLEVIPIGLDYYSLYLRNIAATVAKEHWRDRSNEFARQAADRIMAHDVLMGLNNSLSAEQVIDAIVTLFSMLFAPQEIKFIPYPGNVADQAMVPGFAYGQGEWEQLHQDGYLIEGSGDGFWVTVQSADRMEVMSRTPGMTRERPADRHFGLIRITRIAFPQYIRAYLNIALDTAKMGGVLIENIRMAEELREAQKMQAIGVLAGGIAHHFNNILASMLGYTEMTLEELSQDHSCYSYLQQVLKSGLMARDLIRQMLVFSQKGSDERILVDLAALVHETTTLLWSLMPPLITIVEDIDPDSGFIIAAPSRIKLILINLCTNALQAMEGTSGTVEITLRSVTPDPRLASAKKTCPVQSSC